MVDIPTAGTEDKDKKPPSRWERTWPKIVSGVGLGGVVLLTVYPPLRDISVFLVLAALAQAWPVNKLIDRVIK